MRQAQGTHSEKHGTRTQKLDADTVKIQFAGGGEELRPHRSAGPRQSALRPRVACQPAGFASGKPFHVQTALTEMALITRETMKHVQATGDKRAEKALDELHERLMGDPNPKPVTVLVTRERAR